MKKIILCVSFIFLFIGISNAKTIEVGKKYHITGCENGTLYVPIVNMWSKPCPPPCSRVTGRLSGDGREDKGLKCQGAIIEVLQTYGNWIKVKSVVNNSEGWIQNEFIGRRIK